MRRIDVRVVNGQVPRPRTSGDGPDPDVERRSGALLAKDIVDDQLRKLDDNAKSQGYLDSDHVRTLKDLVAIYDTLNAAERKDTASRGIIDKLKGKSKAELLQIVGAKLVGEEE